MEVLNNYVHDMKIRKKNNAGNINNKLHDINSKFALISFD